MPVQQHATGMSVREVEERDAEAWDGFVLQAPNGSVLQSWEWGEVRDQSGWTPVRLAIYDDRGEIVAAAQVLFRSILGFSIAYVPRGPVVDYADHTTLEVLLRAIHRLAIGRRAVFLKIEPDEPKDQRIEDDLLFRGFRVSPYPIQPLATTIVDLSEDDETRFAKLRRKTRDCIKVAERRGITVHEASGLDDMRRFYGLMQAVSERQDYSVRSLEYYETVYTTFSRHDRAMIHLAEADGEAVAGVFSLAWGDTGISMYAGSSGVRRQDNPNYLAYWRAMQWCKSRGCTRFDMWGIPLGAALGEEGPPVGEDHGYWGIFRFKQRFGGTPIVYAGAFDYPYIRSLYAVWARLRKKQEV